MILAAIRASREEASSLTNFANDSIAVRKGSMKISQASNNALHALAHLATYETKDPVAAHVLAKDCGVSEKLVLKSLICVARVGLLHSLKGPNGGYRLAKPAKSISLADVVEAVDGAIRGSVDVGEVEGKPDLRKKLTTALDSAAEIWRKELQKVSIADLAKTVSSKGKAK